MKAKKRKKHCHGDYSEDSSVGAIEDEVGNEAGDEAEGQSIDGEEHVVGLKEPAASYEFATKEEFEKFRDILLSRIPKIVKSRFREGGFSRWGQDLLPVLELGPFDVEPGPVRDMWMEMFNNVRIFTPYFVQFLTSGEISQGMIL